MAMPTIDRLHEVLEYNPFTGDFHWLVKRNNYVNCGDLAGSASGKYWYICLDGKSIPAHRIAWAMTYGAWPVKHIDHIDGDPGNNRISNLRDVSRSENLGNQHRARRNNSTGFLGVSPKRAKFIATIQVEGKTHSLGCYPTPEEAHQAYLEAKARLNTQRVEKVEEVGA